MSDVTAILPFNFITFLGIFIHYYWQLFMSEVLYFHQIFTDCVSNQYTHFNMLKSMAEKYIIIVFNNQSDFTCHKTCKNIFPEKYFLFEVKIS